MRRLVYVMPLALVFGVAACNDTDEYEARIATLEQDLEAARADADRVQQLTQDTEAAQEMLGAVEEQIAQALEQTSVAVARLTELEATPAAQEVPPENLQDLRDNLHGALESLQTAATELGMDTAAVEPAAGEPVPETEMEPAATEEPVEETEVEPAAGDPAQADADPEEEPVQQQ